MMFYLPSVPRGTRKGLNQELCDVCSYMVSFYETTIETDEKKENILLRLLAGILFQAKMYHFPKPVFRPGF